MTKAEARRRARAALAALSPAERERAGEAVAARLWTLPALASARAILLYASLPEEVPTDAIAREARRRGMVVTYPRCLPETREMVLHRVASDAEFEPGSYGLREPAESCPVLSLAEVDVALVPGLAWDRAGRRLGRGAGYYDRLFARPECRAFRCGLFFAAQELPVLPSDPWDVPLDAVVTERERVRVANYEL